MRESGASEELMIFAASVESEYAPVLADWAGKLDQSG